MTPEPELEEGVEIGTCERCGDTEVRIYLENKRCEDCDGRFYPCSICKEEQFDEDTCRHIFRGDDCEWKGSGAWIDPSLKTPLFRLFDLMPTGFAVDLRVAILSGKFYTFLVAPLIGDGASLSVYGMPERDGRWVETWWGNFLIEIGQGEHSREVADAYHWLASLYQKKTLEANQATVEWIDEYLSAQKEERT